MVMRTGAVRLPDGAYSLRWLSDRIKAKVSSQTFVHLLKALAPDVYTRLSDKSPMGCYFGLVDVLQNMIPLYEPELEFDLADMAGDDPLAELEYRGILIDSFGVDLDADGPCGISSPVIAVCLCAGQYDHDIGFSNRPEFAFGYDAFLCLEQYMGVLPPMPPVPKKRIVDNLKPPRGWEWKGEWRGLRELYAYAHNSTDHMFLDIPHSELFSGMIEFPSWTIDEIKNLAKMWARTKPVWERIQNLNEDINYKPLKRLPLLANVLAGDKSALTQVCVRKSNG